MARNAVLVLVLVGAVLQLCSVVPPVSGAGRRALWAGTTLVNGGMGGTLEAICTKGGGGAGPGELRVIEGALYCYRYNQYASLTVFGHTLANSVPRLPLLEGIPIANGGIGGTLVQDVSGICAKGGGGVGPGTLTLIKGSLYCYNNKQYVSVAIISVTVSGSLTELPVVTRP